VLYRHGLFPSLIVLLFMSLIADAPAAGQGSAEARPALQVHPTDDFEVTGAGDNAAWRKAEWTPLNRRQPEGLNYDSRFKVLYSNTGLYFLMEGTDRKLTATMTQDFMDLWHEDVFEVFLWPDQRSPIYLEYEISPLNYELPILVPNFGGQFLGWRPWHFEGERATRKATSIMGGPKTSGAAIEGWRAEFFIPYAVMKPLQNVPPKAGTEWRANFYRMDYDDGKATQWDWARVGQSFHEYEKFGVLRFTDR
jgi:hypothetical protein